MRRYLLDTGCAGDYVSKRFGVDTRAREVVILGNRVGICVPVLGELFAGIELSETRDRNRKRLIRALSDLTLWPFDRGAAENYGRVFALLRRGGRPMQQIDIQVAAVAFALGNCTVVTKDSDFAAIPGLSIENWSVST